MCRKQAAVTQTLVNYSEESSVHGVGYIFKKSLPLTDRIIWFFSVVLFLTFACYFVFTAYNQWQDSLTITSLENTAMDVTDLEFPAVTLCASGLNMKAVKKVIERNFEEWEPDDSGAPRGKRQTKLPQNYLNETFGTDNLDFLMDIVRSMFYRDIPNDVEVLSVMRYLTDFAAGAENWFDKYFELRVVSTRVFICKGKMRVG